MCAGYSFAFFHDGHCDSGWISPNTYQNSNEDCAKKCVETPGCGYFAYAATSTKCSMYRKSAGCPDDNQFPAFNAYKITGTNTALPRPLWSILSCRKTFLVMVLLPLSLWLTTTTYYYHYHYYYYYPYWPTMDYYDNAYHTTTPTYSHPRGWFGWWKFLTRIRKSWR
jgi:hypothetical protein